MRSIDQYVFPRSTCKRGCALSNSDGVTTGTKELAFLIHRLTGNSMRGNPNLCELRPQMLTPAYTGLVRTRSTSSFVQRLLLSSIPRLFRSRAISRGDILLFSSPLKIRRMHATSHGGPGTSTNRSLLK